MGLKGRRSVFMVKIEIYCGCCEKKSVSWADS
jgi:hypothetical protein